MDNGDKILLGEILTGNQACLSEFFEKYKVMIYAQAYRIIQNREDSLDIVHDTFIKIIGILENGNLKLDNPQAFMRKIALNLSLDFVRARKRHQMLNSLKIFPFMKSKTVIKPWKKIANDELHEKLMKLIMKLSPAEQKVICLRHFEELKLIEIAEICSCSDGAVKKNLHRAYQKLRKMMDKTSADSFLKDNFNMEHENAGCAEYELE